MKSTSSSPSAPFVIPSLDGLRAISFLLVFVGHAGISWVPAGFGVTVFFFLSGYLITTLLRMELERTGRTDLKLFYLRRAIRIWPPFYVVLLGGLAVAMAGLMQASLEISSVAAQALHVWNYWLIVHGWTGVVPGSGVYWSLAVEEHFYFLFPALYILVNRLKLSGKRQFQLFGAICALVLLWRCALVFGLHVGIERTFVATDTRIDSILFGCGLAVYRNPILDEEARERPRLSDLLSLGAGLAVLMFAFIWRSDAFRETIRYTLQGMALYPVFSAAIRFPRWGFFRVLNLRPVRFVGTLSYSLYLVHYTIIHAVEETRDSFALPVRMLLSLGACLVVAYAIWRFVEEPCNTLRRNLSRAATKAATPRDASDTAPRPASS